MDSRTRLPSQPDDDTVDAALFEGHVDAIEAGRIYGWAFDPTAPSERLSVTIFHGDDELATVVADRYREDLCGLGDESGRHAFVFTLPRMLWDAEPASFHVVHAGSTVPLVRSDREVRSVPDESDEVPDWLAPVSGRISHLETALVSTARAAASTQINLRKFDLDNNSERLSAIEHSQMRIEHVLGTQAAAISELRAALDALRGGGRLHLILTLAMLVAVAALVYQVGGLP